MRRGAIKANHFQIVLRKLSGSTADLSARFANVVRHGIPNYFGPQRFGRDGGNLQKAHDLFAGHWTCRDRYLRGLILSAARSHLFNLVTGSRVAQGCWDQAVQGDVMMLDGTHSVFAIECPDGDIARRVADQDLHPTGPLWGTGLRMASGQCKVNEDNVLQNHTLLCHGLERAGLTQERRALRVRIRDAQLTFGADNTATVRFGLPAGAFATSVLRELVRTVNPASGTVDASDEC